MTQLASHIRSLVRGVLCFGSRPKAAGPAVDRDDPQPILTRERLAELFAILDERSVARRRAERRDRPR